MKIEELDDTRLRIDFSSRREQLGDKLMMVAAVLFVGTVLFVGAVLFSTPDWNRPHHHGNGLVIQALTIALGLFGGSVALFLGGGLFRRACDDYLVLNTESREIVLHREFLESRSDTVEAAFDEVTAVVSRWSDGRNRDGLVRRWQLFLELNKDRAIALGDAIERPRAVGEPVVVPLDLERGGRRLRELFDVEDRVEDAEWQPQIL